MGPRPWDVVGVVIFNFAFCVTVPAWLNEKVPSSKREKDDLGGVFIVGGGLIA